LTLSDHDLVQRSDGLLTTHVDGEVLAMSIDNGACYGLDRIATRVWELIERPIRIDAICTALEAEFEVSPAICRRDVTELLGTLLARGILIVRPS
jgi:hypothetical protein